MRAEPSRSALASTAAGHLLSLPTRTRTPAHTHMRAHATCSHQQAHGNHAHTSRHTATMLTPAGTRQPASAATVRWGRETPACAAMARPHPTPAQCGILGPAPLQTPSPRARFQTRHAPRCRCS
eukprot:364190-Chlamydomonas_euryale.AAC.5